MSDKKTFGYKYNNVGELVVDKNEAEIVKLIFDLTQNYKLNSSEVVDFLNKTKTVVEIISNRIDDFIVVISRYDKNKSKILEKHNFDDILNEILMIFQRITEAPKNQRQPSAYPLRHPCRAPLRCIPPPSRDRRRQR